MIMDVLLSIGDFSRMTYLSVKALRHYHEVGVLEPARVDQDTGYRFYRPDQIATAQIIRRFRELGMPLSDLRAMVRAPDPGARTEAIITHLDRMERQLEQTQEAVVSLRTLLREGRSPLQVHTRFEPVTPALAVVAQVAAAEAAGWWLATFRELHRAVAATGRVRTGPDGALFSSDFFENDGGEVTAFVPVTAGAPAFGRVTPLDVPAAHLAVALHRGPFGDLDRTYGELGTWVAEQAAGAAGAIRERYLPLGRPDDLLHHQTEVCWPLTGGAPEPEAGPPVPGR